LQTDRKYNRDQSGKEGNPLIRKLSYIQLYQTTFTLWVMGIHIWNRTIASNVYTVNEYDYDRNEKMFETIETDSIAFAKGENP